jgi:hypothetical protein
VQQREEADRDARDNIESPQSSLSLSLSLCVCVCVCVCVCMADRDETHGRDIPDKPLVFRIRGVPHVYMCARV